MFDQSAQLTRYLVAKYLYTYNIDHVQKKYCIQSLHSIYEACDKKVRFNLKEGYAEGVCCIALHRSSFLSMCRSFRLRSMYVSIILL